MAKTPENFEARRSAEIYQPPESEPETEVLESKTETPEELVVKGRRELHEFTIQGEQGLRTLETSAGSSGLSKAETQGYLESHQVPQQLEEMGRVGRGFFARMKSRIEMVAAIGLAAATMAQARPIEARPVTEPAAVLLAQDSPQREAYKDYDSYKRYVEAVRDLKGEEQSAKKQEELRKKIERFQKEADRDKENIVLFRNEADKCRKNGWNDLAESYLELARGAERGQQQWLNLVKGVQEDLSREEKQDPKNRYEEAKALSREEFQLKAEVINRAFQKADEERSWINQVVNSESYSKKAKEHENLTDDEINRRKQAVQSKDAHMADPYHILAEDSIGHYRPEDSSLDNAGKYILSPKEQAEGQHTAVHELEHAVTEGDKKMSNYAKELYRNSYNGPDAATEDGKYYSKPTEMDARKRVFEYDLETQGIWNYGETFTEEHLQKAIDLALGGKLSPGSEEFLANTKYENIPLIMNTIARDISANESQTEKSA